MALKTIGITKLVVLLALTCLAIPLAFVGFKFNKLKNTQSYFDNLDEALKCPAQVKVLIIRNEGLDSLPERIGELTNLSVLNLANNHLKKLPESIGRLHQLEELSLEDNLLRKLPTSIRNLRKLKAINLCGNLFQSLPSELRGLESLRSLSIARNQLEKINLYGFENLTAADLSDNSIMELSFGKEMNSIRKLDLNNNRLETVPKALFTLTSLNELILSENPLDKTSKTNYENFLKRRQPDDHKP